MVKRVKASPPEQVKRTRRVSPSPERSVDDDDSPYARRIANLERQVIHIRDRILDFEAMLQARHFFRLARDAA